jgi:hypothetical protein
MRPSRFLSVDDLPGIMHVGMKASMFNAEVDAPNQEDGDVDPAKPCESTDCLSTEGMSFE